MADGLALVTGAPGWLGNRLLHYLAEPHPDYPEDAPPISFDRIRCLVLPGTPPDVFSALGRDVELVEGDLRDPAALGRLCEGAEGATAFHLGGIVHPKRRVKDLYDINAKGTDHLIAAAAAAGVKRIVAISSNSPVGATRDPAEILDEQSPYRPYSHYGRSKLLMENALNTAHESGAVETTILRPCWFYGPDQPPRQTLFFKMIKSGKGPIVGKGEAGRSMSYVDNTSLGLLLGAAQPKAAGETYWIADERPYTVGEVTDVVEDVLENDFGMEVAHKRLTLPRAACEAAHLADRGIQATGFYVQKVHVLGLMGHSISCSIAKARDQLGYRPKIELREGMRRSIEWCLANGQAI